MRARITKKDGKIVAGRDQLSGVINSLTDGDYIISVMPLEDPHTVEEWRKYYFALRDTLHDSAETGHTKKELHEAIKSKVLDTMMGDDFSNDNGWFQEGLQWDNPSTKFLSTAGWKEFVTRFKELAMDMWEVYL